MENLSLNSELLYRNCDYTQFQFNTTDNLETMTGNFGQERAIEALQFGTEISHKGYNIFIFGPPGSGKRSITENHLKQIAATQPAPSDWCYLSHFQNPQKPIAIEFPAGKGRIFKEDMRRLLEDLRLSIVSVLKGKDFEEKRDEIRNEYRQKQTQLLSVIREKAAKENILLLETPRGFVFTPSKDGEIISPEEYEKLTLQQKKDFKEKIENLHIALEAALVEIQNLRSDLRDKIRVLNEQIILQATIHLVESLKQKYIENTRVLDYLSAMQNDVLEHIDDFFTDQKETELFKSFTEKLEGVNPFRRYDVNLFIDQSLNQGAPVIYEDTPNLMNLVGSIEHIAKMGALLTDFMLIKPGALHRANGGYLLIDANKLLMYPHAWESLKKALRTEEIKIESLSELYSFASTLALEPEAIPLKVKVLLIGPEWLYYLFANYDLDFFDHFKIGADFDNEIVWNSENEILYSRFIAMIIQKEKLKPFTAKAVARLIEHGARLSGNSDKLTVQWAKIVDLIKEANHFAQREDDSLVHDFHIQKAIDFQIRRSNRIYQRLLDETLQRTLIINTEGFAVGTINGLSVYILGDFMFGHPSRITARVRMGDGSVLDIQREVKMGGPSHSKGVLILDSFITSRYVVDEPISFSASLVFEQTYGEVDGDSASLAEAVTLLSAIAEVPLKQSIAITGSMNQNGEVQAIGGVNFKIEGFFDLCNARGLKGDEGVVIPKANIKHLMLKEEVVRAVKDNKFQIYAVENIDQCIEVISKIEAGELNEFKKFPVDSFNGKVEKRLLHFASKRTENISKQFKNINRTNNQIVSENVNEKINKSIVNSINSINKNHFNKECL